MKAQIPLETELDYVQPISSASSNINSTDGIPRVCVFSLPFFLAFELVLEARPGKSEGPICSMQPVLPRGAGEGSPLALTADQRCACLSGHSEEPARKQVERTGDPFFGC